MRVAPAANVARINVAETITALWTFANANGIALDDIIERSEGAGVTIDGVTLRDIAVELVGLAATSDIVFQSDVVGDAFRRFVQRADGGMEWGDGAGARDVNLIRAAANVLATLDSFQVAGVLGLITNIITERTADAGVDIDGLKCVDKSIEPVGQTSAAASLIRAILTGDSNNRFILRNSGQMEWGPGDAAIDVTLRRSAEGVLRCDEDFQVGGLLNPRARLAVSLRSASLVTGNNHNVDTGPDVVQRFTPTTPVSNITGFAGGLAGRIIIVQNVIADGTNLQLEHENGGSIAANRIICPDIGSWTMTRGEGTLLFYDDGLSRWYVVATLGAP